MVLIFGLLVLGLGVFFISKSIQTKKEVERYEFENRTDGGVVQFANYEAKKKFDWKRGRITGFMMLGVVTIFLGLTFTLIGLSK